MNTKELRIALAVAALVWNFIRTATAEDFKHAAVVTVIFLIVMFIIYWYNNSHTKKAKIGDYVKDTVDTAIKEADLSVVDQVMNALGIGGDLDDNKRK